MNRTPNMRTIIFLEHKSLDLRFYGENMNNFKRNDFLFLQKENYSFLCFSGKKENLFLHIFLGRERENVFFLSLVFHGESSHRKRVFS